MPIHNCMEEIVSGILAEIVTKDKSICTCMLCQDDIMAIALNKIRPRYVATTAGEIYIKAEQLDYQNKTDVIFALLEAIEIVSNKNRH